MEPAVLRGDRQADLALVAGGGAVLHRVLGEREEQERRHGDAARVASSTTRDTVNRSRIAHAVELEERVDELELALERPPLGAHAREHRAQHLGEAEDGLLGDDAVDAAPLGDRVERVEEEMRIEVGAEREELRVLGLARERLGARALRGELGLEIDVAPEAEAADEVERRAR